MTGLLESDIFCHNFDFDDWPLINKDNSFKCVPYNGSMFQLRGKYCKVFHQNIKEFKEGDEDGCDKPNEHQMLKKSDRESFLSTKVYKIKYTLNLLPGRFLEGEEDGEPESIVQLLAETEDMEIF